MEHAEPDHMRTRHRVPDEVESFMLHVFLFLPTIVGSQIKPMRHIIREFMRSTYTIWPYYTVNFTVDVTETLYSTATISSSQRTDCKEAMSFNSCL